mgnify:FL=1
MFESLTSYDFYGTIYSLIPPLLMIVLVLLTKRVLISLGAGIVVGIFMIENFNFVESLKGIWFTFQNIFYSEGEWDFWSIQLILFLILLGILIAFLTATGGARAFGNWAIERVKTQEGSQYTAGLLGIAIFIDDYFNSLTIGQVARPITDRQKVSRAKLAYIIDSTSAPVTVLSPISSWGAYIIGIITLIISDLGLSNVQAFDAFIRTIPLNYYAIGAIILVFITIYFKVDFGLMDKHERRAQETGELIDPSRPDVPGDLKDGVIESENGKIYHLILPIIILVVSTVTSMIITGIQATEGDLSIISIFENTDVNLSLVIGGLISVIVASVLYFLQSGEKTAFPRVTLEGIRAMLPAIYILVLAWMIVSVIGELGTDEYLANIVKENDFNIAYIPLVLFLISGFMAFATGTSWGTFGIMLPIAAAIAANVDVTFLIPSMAAVLAGSVFGDHVSPISDTTVLSSTGAGSNHIDHVLTQLPYALLVAGAASIGYLMYGLTTSVLLGLAVTIGILFIVVYVISRKRN